MIHIEPFQPGDQPALIRYVNAGAVNYPFHPHGNNQQVITRDGSPTVDTNGIDSSYEKFLIDVGPGQSVDTLDKWRQEYDPADNPIPSDIQLPQLQDQIVGPGTETWFSENPYLGGTPGPAAPRASCRTTSAVSTTTSPTATPSTRRRTTARASAG